MTCIKKYSSQIYIPTAIKFGTHVCPNLIVNRKKWPDVLRQNSQIGLSMHQYRKTFGSASVNKILQNRSQRRLGSSLELCASLFSILTVAIRSTLRFRVTELNPARGRNSIHLNQSVTATIIGRFIQISHRCCRCQLVLSIATNNFCSTRAIIVRPLLGAMVTSLSMDDLLFFFALLCLSTTQCVSRQQRRKNKPTKPKCGLIVKYPFRTWRLAVVSQCCQGMCAATRSSEGFTFFRKLAQKKKTDANGSTFNLRVPEKRCAEIMGDLARVLQIGLTFFFTILSFIVVSWWRTLYVNWLHYSTHCGTRQQTSSH